MGKNVAKKNKVNKKARKAAERRRQVRASVICLGVIALCIACLAVLAHLGRAPEQQETWYIQNGGLEIAAPGMTKGGPATLDGSVGTAEGETEAGEDSAYAIPMPELPSRASEAPTATPEPTAEPTPEATPAPTPIVTPEPEYVTLTITAAGDCTLGGSVNQDTYQKFKNVVQKNGYDYFFKNVRRVFQADDLTILNLEGPLTDVGNGRHGMYCFKGDPDFVKIMTGSSVELCNVANNHSLDFGKAGLKRTAEVLEQAGIGCCGYTKVYNGTIKGVRVTALGFDKWQNDKAGIVQAIQRERANCDLLIVNMHWGREKHFEPMKDQVDWGHAAIDAGADLVIGTHPHVYGGVELYKGKYIAYSLGNFCFGGNTVPSDQRCLMFQQTFQVSPSGQVSDGGINVIPCLVSGDKKKNDFQPYILGEQPGKSLLKNVARYSNLNKKTLWMQNSYPEQIGLITADNRVSTVPSSSGAAVATSADAAAQDTALTTAAQAAQDDAWEDATDSAWEDAASDGGQESGQLVGEFMASDDAMTRLRIFEDQIGN